MDFLKSFGLDQFKEQIGTTTLTPVRDPDDSSKVVLKDDDDNVVAKVSSKVVYQLIAGKAAPDKLQVSLVVDDDGQEYHLLHRLGTQKAMQTL